MRKLDQYILAQFLNILVMALIGFISIFVIVDLIENLDRFIDNSVPGTVVLQYYLFSLPWFANIALPMSVLISTVFSIGLMAKRNEWTAMKSSGISLYRIAVPLVICGLLLSSVSYVLDNQLVTWGNEHRFNIEREYIKRKARKSIRKPKKVMQDVFLQKKGSLNISLDTYRTYTKEAQGVNIVKLDSGLVRSRIDAKKMAFIDSLQQWVVSDFSIRTFDSSGTEKGIAISTGDTLLTIGFVPNDISQQFKSPEELNREELKQRIALLEENGVNTRRWEVVKQFKISFAFTNLIVILFGLPLVVMKLKGGLTFGAGMSVFVIFSYYAVIKFGQSMGFKGILEPLLSAWIGNIVFIIGGIILILLARK